MNEPSQPGYIYRIARADAALVRTLVADIVGSTGWTFGGAALWDLDVTQRQSNLRRISSVAGDLGANLDVRGDFGHAFSDAAEVRWKRRDQDVYDVLILSEQERMIENAQPLTGPWTTQRQDNLTMMQTGPDNRPLGYVTYHASNGAVQFIRYREVC